LKNLESEDGLEVSGSDFLIERLADIQRRESEGADDLSDR
jgi:hypothetical protein